MMNIGTVPLTRALGAGWGEAREHAFWRGWHPTAWRGGGGKNSLKPPAHYPGPWAARLFHLSETYLSSKDQVKSPHFRAVLLDQPHQSGFSFLTARGAVGSVCITLGLLLSTRQTAHAHVCVRERVPPPPGIQPLLQLGRASSPPSPLSKNVSWLMDISTSWVHHTSSSDGRSFY